MKSLYKVALRWCAAGNIAAVVSCHPSEDVTEFPISAEYTEAFLHSQVSTDATLELVCQVVDEALFAVTTHPGHSATGPAIDGTMVWHDKDLQLISVDLGGAESNLGGPVSGGQKSGKLALAYTDLRLVDGATYTVSFDRLSIGQVRIEGALTITYISKTPANKRKYTVVLQNGKFTWPNGSFVLRESDHLRTVLAGNLSMHDEITWEGAASGTTVHGYPFTSIITEPLRFRKTCIALGDYFPSSGSSESTTKGASVIVGYGEGDCDNLARVTINGNVSEEELFLDSQASDRG